MKNSESISKIIPALLEAQKKIQWAKKGSENPYFKSKYADLPSVIDACKETLNQNGIVALQPIQNDVVETILIHSSGEWLSSETRIVCKAANDPQAYGSAITYARRYGLQSFVLMPAEDDDAEGAMDRTQEKKIKPEDYLQRAVAFIEAAKTVDALQQVETRAQELGKFSKEQLDEIHSKVMAKADKLAVKK